MTKKLFSLSFSVNGRLKSYLGFHIRLFKDALTLE